MKSPGQSDKGPQYVPADVAYAVFAMWAGLALSAAFAVFEFWSASSILDPMERLFLFSAYVLTVLAVPRKMGWARYVAVVLTVLFYAALALDADGLTVTDLLHLAARFPIDAFVISRLFNPSVTRWLMSL